MRLVRQVAFTWPDHDPGVCYVITQPGGVCERFVLVFQAPYFTEWLRWAGVLDVSEVYFRPNLVTEDADAARQSAHAAARDAAKAL